MAGSKDAVTQTLSVQSGCKLRPYLILKGSNVLCLTPPTPLTFTWLQDLKIWHVNSIVHLNIMESNFYHTPQHMECIII